MQFNRLRLSGFKSFVDPTEVMIEPGLTGVVGPNGCGKSNILEALRWAMGESSPKSMRGAGMDDVIFAGTERRPPRNLAEVTLILDNTARKAPAALNNDEVIEVSRRIEREAGSAYRINGRDVRQKDVQLLFADAATGAHSPALVSQGQIGALINAKPRDRRGILEEAAGVSGLYSRRKEAESRLNAAEVNLERLEDVVIQMDGQVASLKRQARQATRYRNISGDIRRAEAQQLYVKWHNAEDRRQTLEAELKQAELKVAELTREAARLSAEEAELSASLPALREAEAEAAAAVHRIALARDGLDAEEARLKEARERLKARLAQIGEDTAREKERAGDAQEVIARISAEQAELTAADAGQADALAAAKERLEVQNRATRDAEAELRDLTLREAQLRANIERLEDRQWRLQARIEKLADERQAAEAAIAELTAESGELEVIRAAEAALTAAEGTAASAAEAESDAMAARETFSDAHLAARDAHTEARRALSALEAEHSAIASLLAAGAGRDDDAPVSELLTVTQGYEAALGAALGDDLEAPVSDTAALRWQRLPELAAPPPLPAGATPLGDFVQAPAELARRLSQTGVVAAGDGARLAAELKPGQRLVTAEGALWRWDGFAADADAPSAAALRLGQKNRLEELAREIAKSQKTVVKLEGELTAASEELAQRRREADQARTARSEAEAARAQAARALREAEHQASERNSRLGGLREALERLAADYDDAGERLRGCVAELESLPDPETMADDLAQAQTKLDETRGELAEARAAHETINREAEARAARLATLNGEARSWSARAEDAGRHLQELDRRRVAGEAELADLATDPAYFEDKRKALIDQFASAEARRNEAADVLALADAKLAAKSRENKEFQAHLGQAREARVRLETNNEAVAEQLRELVHQIDERFQSRPEDLTELGKIKPDQPLPEIEAIEARLDRLRRERERLGSVNLRAEEELRDLEQQIEHLGQERADLESAIARLRRAIQSLNREGRERLMQAFEEVDTHFAELFTKLFGGGHAHLALVESDDPLEAGIEIMASPPGKKLQVMSLLSGGEQALTALSLIFAVFMTNPAPICVLDEVDAPLDDANVERFCDLLDEIRARTETRFLIVTHNAITMARLDRLYGVTMAERGVSQLVSVDLAGVEELQAAE
ncbi:MAG: chromosome segregation protein SMC [Sphingomonadales bacterium]|nr:chromosome segregation protein SMC [Sphingomonadales bacterium]